MALIDGVVANLERYVLDGESAKNAILARLVSDDYLTTEQAEDFADNYGIIIIKKSWYQRIFSGEEYMFQCVKLTDVAGREE